MGREVQKEKERTRNNPLCLSPFALFSHHFSTFKINPRLEGEDAAVEEHSPPGFSVEKSDFHEHEQETSP